MQRNVFEPWFFLNPKVVIPFTCKCFHGRYALGLGFISLVAVIWTISSVIAQYLYAEEEFGSAFLITYLGFIEFAFILPIKLWTDSVGFTQDVCLQAPPDDDDEDDEIDQSQIDKSTDYRDIVTAVTDDISVKTSQIIRKLPKNVHWNHTKHFQAACFIAPIMFIANWTFNAALATTSVASSTVLVSTSSVFVFVFAVLAGDETYTHVKLMGVMLGILGTALTTFHDLANHDDDDDGEACANGCDYVLWGDSLSLVAAVAYAAYAVQVRVLCPKDEELYSMVLLLGYIGLVILVPLLPAAILLLTQFELTGTVLLIILTRGFLDYVVSEYLHFRAVILTNATTATVGLGLTIPMAFVADGVMGKANVASTSSLLGAVAVMCGFLVVNISNAPSSDSDVKEHDTGEVTTAYEMMEKPPTPPPMEVVTPRRGVMI